MKLQRIFSKTFASIGTKIVLPYLILTLIVAGIGAFIIVNLVTSSLQERFHNQLLDSGRVVAESMVGFEEERLEALRLIAHTEGVAEAISVGDAQTLASLVPQILANSNMDAVALLNKQGREIYGRFNRASQPDGPTTIGTDFSQLRDVQLVLDGHIDEYGDKRAFMARMPDGDYFLFTIGPALINETIVGAVLVGTDVREMVVNLTENAVARVTLYDNGGQPIATTMGDGHLDNTAAILQTSPQQYAEIVRLLQESPERYQVVTTTADEQVPLRQVEILNQTYQLAYGDWRLRNRSFGLFSVSLPSNFIVTTAATSRNLLNLVFSLATVAVFTIGILLARRIVKPLNRLVQITTAVSQGNLEQHTGIERRDEIGTLAQSFDIMTERLAQRNQKLMEQSSELAAILHSIADGVIVMDADHQIVTTNPAAQQILDDMAYGMAEGQVNISDQSNGTDFRNELLQATPQLSQPKRYKIGERVLSALSAPVKTPENNQIGTVMVLRDITRDAEAENLKDAFITSVSHELRTPLTVVRMYADLSLKIANGTLSDKQLSFLEKINQGTEDLERHIEKLINISEIQAGTINLNKENINLTQLIRTISDKWRNRFVEKEILFSVQLPEQELCVNADAAHLSWAIDNLLSNAFNYTPRQEGCVQIHVKQEKEFARVDVIDNGVGIAAADQKYLFERFFRGSNEVNFTTRGIGLGLFITRALIELHGGNISVDSKIGIGSTFSCKLPLSDYST